ncbi:copper resistance protein NlpE [Mesonia sediminis]|uniref:Copper resistance protein NlpE n=1 Tax=Mesonia sediminis TaxID=1703946 RepID=A0ABW5SC92_9FLAO
MKSNSLLLFILIALLFSCKTDQKNSRVEDARIEGVEPEEQEPEVTIDEHTSRISLDWAATYEGVLPCADCGGIETAIVLNEDMTYQKQEIYLDENEEPFISSGKFVWNESGNEIELKEEDGPTYYRVLENKLIQLNQAREEIEGDLAASYYLMKK